MEDDRHEPRIGELEEDPSTPPDQSLNALGNKPRGVARWAIPLLIILAVAWFLLPDPDTEPAPDTAAEYTEVPQVGAEMPPAPDIPVPSPSVLPESPDAPDLPASPPLAPELALDDSDEPVRVALAGVGNAELVGDSLQQDDLLQRATALIG